MKVLNVTNTFFSITYFLGDQLKHFTDKGYEISLVTTPDSNLRSFAEERDCAYKEINIPRVIDPVEDIKAFFKLLGYVRKERFDIVCGHTPLGGLLAVSTGWLCGVRKRIFFRHGLVYETSSGFSKFVMIACERLASWLATKVVCVSPYLVERSVADRLTRRKKLVILNRGSCNGVDALNRFCPEKIDRERVGFLKRRYGIPEGSFVVGFAGRIVKDKGIEELVEAFSKISSVRDDVYLLLVGMLETKDAIESRTEDEIRNNQRIIHTGLIYGEMEYYYSMMDVFVLCTHREGFGSSLIEAAAMEIPTLTTNHTGSRDAIVDGQTGMYVKMGDSDSVANAIMKYINNPELRLLHGRNGRKFVLENFNQEIIWDEIEDKVYEPLSPRP